MLVTAVSVFAYLIAILASYLLTLACTKIYIVHPQPYISNGIVCWNKTENEEPGGVRLDDSDLANVCLGIWKKYCCKYSFF